MHHGDPTLSNQQHEFDTVLFMDQGYPHARNYWVVSTRDTSPRDTTWLYQNRKVISDSLQGHSLLSIATSTATDQAFSSGVFESGFTKP